MIKGKKILIVEDEMVISLEIAATLKRLGYIVAGQAITGNDALKLVEETDPDLILMDIRLKGNMDGIEAACQVSDRFDLPVIFLTAHSDEATLERAIAVSPSGYLIKPFKDRELYSSIELALHKHDIRQRIRPERIVREVQSDLAHLSDVSALVISPRGIIIRANQKACDLFETDQDDLCGTQITTWICTDTPILDVLSGSEGSILPYNVAVRSLGGTIKKVNIEAGFIAGEEGRIRGYLLAIPHVC
ncbi:ATP-binding response regulator [Methanospirillum lacunae]|uniref:ATP-binding response regulator n=1 Tax=Methanospirillum lacunae TaxID=668570 RepID=UPI001C63CBA1|nr:response regulator [Methanospirillum lacunae]